MPRKIPNDLTSIGGKSTPLGRENFLRKAQEIRERILESAPVYVDVTNSVMTSEYRGSSSRPIPANPSRKGSKMPKAITKLNNVSTINGKRGRKAEFKSDEFVMDIGIENALDVTEEMVNGIEKLDEQFDAELLFGNDNADANKYRSNRFGALKRAAILANGEGTKYTLNHGENEDGDRVWVLVRTA